MKPNIKLTLIIGGSVLAGAGVGVTCTYVVMNKRTNTLTAGVHEHYRQYVKEASEVKHRLDALTMALDMETGDVSDRILDHVNSILAERKKYEGEYSPISGEEAPKDTVDDKGASINVMPIIPLQQPKAKTMQTPYHTLYNGSYANVEPPRAPSVSTIDETPIFMPETEEKDPDEPTEEEQEAMSDTPPDPQIRTHERPFVITARDCGASWHDVECLTYYDGDGTLVDDTEQAVNIDDYIGEENLSEFVDNLLYIRNDKFGMDYEVRWEPGRYVDTLGVPVDVHGTPLLDPNLWKSLDTEEIQNRTKIRRSIRDTGEDTRHD